MSVYLLFPGYLFYTLIVVMFTLRVIIGSVDVVNSCVPWFDIKSCVYRKVHARKWNSIMAEENYKYKS